MKALNALARTGQRWVSGEEQVLDLSDEENMHVISRDLQAAAGADSSGG